MDKTKLKIRRKNRMVNEQIKILGFNEEGIRNMKKQEFQEFIKMKAFYEQLLLSWIPIVVTTCAASQTKALSKFRFTKVVIDEATQAKEVETLATMANAQ